MGFLRGGRVITGAGRRVYRSPNKASTNYLTRHYLSPFSQYFSRHMASAAISGLPAPLKDLVLAVAKEEGAKEFGVTEQDKAEVEGWIKKVAGGEISNVESLKNLDTQLTPRTYAVGNALTAADVALYGALHPTFTKLESDEYYAHPALTRYFDHIQSTPAVRAVAGESFPLVTLDLAGAPKLERKPDPPKERKKKDAAALPADAAPAGSSDATPAPAEKTAEKKAKTENTAPVEEKEKKAKKEKKEKVNKEAKESGKKSGAATPAADEGAGEPVPSMIDLRVGHIVHIEKHPDADGLYVEQIDFGEETGPRTVVSGLVNYIPIENMRDKYLVGVCNLKPANMRGVKSFAMVLCATSKDGKDAGIELVQPPADSKPGDRVYFEGDTFENAQPLSQLNPKKKIFETIQPGFTTLESKEAAWVNPATNSIHRIRTANGVCIAPTFVGASLS